MTSRRDFLRRCGLIAAGVVAADQLEVWERLTSRRVFTTGGYVPMGSSRFLVAGDFSLYNGAVFQRHGKSSLRWWNQDGESSWTLSPITVADLDRGCCVHDGQRAVRS